MIQTLHLAQNNDNGNDHYIGKLLHCYIVTLIYYYINYLVSLTLKISPKTPLAVTCAPAPAPMMTIGFSP